MPCEVPELFDVHGFGPAPFNLSCSDLDAVLQFHITMKKRVNCHLLFVRQANRNISGDLDNLFFKGSIHLCGIICTTPGKL